MKKVLHVEDIEDARKLVVRNLNKDYKIDRAKNSSEALIKYKKR